MGKAARAFKRAPKGTDIGGEFIGPKSIAHALIRVLTGAGNGKPGSLTADSRQNLPRPKLLAAARKLGVQPKRGAPARDIVARMRSAEQPGAARARHLLAHWGTFGDMHGLDQLARMRAEPQTVKRRLAAARSVNPNTHGRFTWPLVVNADQNRKGGSTKGGPGNIPTVLRTGAASSVPAPNAVPPTANPLRRGVRGDVRVEGRIQRWLQGLGPSDPFEGFGREPMRKAAKARGIQLKRGAGRTDIGKALLADARGDVRGARDAAANPPTGIAPGAPRIGNETKYHRDLSDVRELVDAVDSGIKDRKMANQGMVGETWIERFKNGTRAIHKWSKREWAGSDAKTQADAEQLASLLGRAIDAPVPKVYRHNDTEIYMEFVPDAQTGEEAFGDISGKDLPDHIRDSPAGRRLGLLDLLVANFDRHGGNYMVDKDGNVHGIDHGLAWSPRGMEMLPPLDPPPMENAGPFGRHFLSPNEKRGWFGPDSVWATHDMTMAEIDDIRGRVEALRPDFDRLGRGHWLDYALKRLEVIRFMSKDAAQHAPVRQAPKATGIGAVGNLRKLPPGVGPSTAARAARALITTNAGQRTVDDLLDQQPVAVLRKMVQQVAPDLGNVGKMNRVQLLNVLGLHL